MGVELDSAAVIQALKRGKAMANDTMLKSLRDAADRQNRIRREMTDRWTKYQLVDRFDTHLRMILTMLVYFPAIIIAVVVHHYGFLTPAAVLVWVIATTGAHRLGSVLVGLYIRREYDQVDAEYDHA